MNKHYLPSLVLAVLIFVGGSISTSPLEALQKSHLLLGILFSEFSLHFFGFGLFALSLCYGFNKLKYRDFPVFKIGLYSFALGLFIEVYQIMLPHRDFSFLDLAFDIAGIGGALVLFGLLRGRAKEKI